MKDDEKVILHTVIALLAGIVVFLLTITVPIKSGFLQCVSGGTIVVSGVGLISTGIKKLKEKKEYKEFESTINEVHKETRNPLDTSYFISKRGKYYNNGSIYYKKIVGVKFNFNYVLRIVNSYVEATKHNDYIVWLKTTNLLNASRESELRNYVKDIDGQVVIVKDISSFSVPDGVYDVNVIIAKVKAEGVKRLLDYFCCEELGLINIVDDYNSTVFSSEDTDMAYNENYKFKFFVNSETNEYNLYIRYGVIENIENFVEQITGTMIDKKH